MTQSNGSLLFNATFKVNPVQFNTLFTFHLQTNAWLDEKSKQESLAFLSYCLLNGEKKVKSWDNSYAINSMAGQDVSYA